MQSVSTTFRMILLSVPLDCVSARLYFSHSSFSYTFPWPWPSSDSGSALSFCVAAMSGELIWTLIESQTVHMGWEHNHSLSPPLVSLSLSPLLSLSLSLVGRTLISNPFIHALTEPTPTTKALADFQQKNTELLPSVPLHNWLHLMRLCMLKCHTHKCNSRSSMSDALPAASGSWRPRQAPRTPSHVNMWQTQVYSCLHLCLTL